jgi:NADPH-dependent curcumin reductase CurA
VKSREWRLAARPQGMPKPADFELAEVEVGEPDDGQAVIRNAFMSVDPYMRGRMNDVKSYVPPFQLGEVLYGGAVGEVIASRNERLAEGDWVSHQLGWRELAVSDGRGVQRVDPSLAPPQAYLSVLGMIGLTAYVGVLDIGQPKEGETVFVSGAAGAVGSLAGQIARIKGCRVIGSAGSDEKVAWLRDELGFDRAFNYKTASLKEELADGIDVYFDNVGGEHLEAAIFALRTYGRIVACGSISRYNDTEPRPGPRNMHMITTKRLRVQGYIVFDHNDRYPEFAQDASGWLRDGSLKYRETIVDGLEHAPDALIGLLEGANTGKMLVRL